MTYEALLEESLELVSVCRSCRRRPTPLHVITTLSDGYVTVCEECIDVKWIACSVCGEYGRPKQMDEDLERVPYCDDPKCRVYGHFPDAMDR